MLVHLLSLNTRVHSVAVHINAIIFVLHKKMFLPIVLPCMGINTKSSSVKTNFESKPRIHTARCATSLTFVLTSIGMEKASKCLEMLHNWILKLFAMSSVLSATVCRVRLIFLKSFLYQDITLTDQTFFNKTPICDRLLIRSNQMWQHITFFHCHLNYRTKRLENILLLIKFFPYKGIIFLVVDHLLMFKIL
jgi:hypothetical protein